MPDWGPKLTCLLKEYKMTNISAITSSFERLLPTALGFENAFAALDNAAHLVTATQTAFPPVNIVKTGDYTFNVELAVAGYKREEIEITAEKNSLKVTGKKTEDDAREYLVKGIAGRKFARQFVLSDTVVVQWAELADGILSIALENVIPEEQKPRKIEIK
jgi:molecular chaperone IbpA